MEGTPESIIRSFYSAMHRKDYAAMQSLYHKDATFSDPIFLSLNSRQVKAMWQMLLTSSTDLKVTFTPTASMKDNSGGCHWEAHYTFSKTGRFVHNIIDASFIFADGLILRHTDSFDLWRWSRLALGPIGLLLGWSPLLRNELRKTARARLEHFMQKQL